MGYYIIFKKRFGGFKVYNQLVKEKAEERKRELKFEGKLHVFDEKYWKERESQGIVVQLSWLCDRMERHRFDLVFLTENYAVFKRRVGLRRLADWLGL